MLLSEASSYDISKFLSVGSINLIYSLPTDKNPLHINEIRVIRLRWYISRYIMYIRNLITIDFFDVIHLFISLRRKTFLIGSPNYKISALKMYDDGIDTL